MQASRCHRRPCAAPAGVLGVLDDPPAAEELLSAGKSAALVTGAHQALITLLSARRGHHRLFADQADPQGAWCCSSAAHLRPGAAEDGDPDLLTHIDQATHAARRTRLGE
jgi:hypothetical protein